MNEGAPTHQNELTKIPFEARQPVQRLVAEAYLDWKLKKYGIPGTPANPDTPSWGDFIAVRRSWLINDVLADAQAKTYTGDPSLDIPERQKRAQQVIDAIDYEIREGVIQKY